MPKNPDRPPADAIPLSEFFSIETADPRLRAAQQQAEERLNAAKAAIPPTLGGSRRAYNPRHRFAQKIQAADEAFQRAGRAVADELHNRLRTGEWSAWGREGSPVGLYQQLDADAWEYLEIERGRSWDAPIANVVSYSAPSRRVFFRQPPRRSAGRHGEVFQCCRSQAGGGVQAGCAERMVPENSRTEFSEFSESSFRRSRLAVQAFSVIQLQFKSRDLSAAPCFHGGQRSTSIICTLRKDKWDAP